MKCIYPNFDYYMTKHGQPQNGIPAVVSYDAVGLIYSESLHLNPNSIFSAQIAVYAQFSHTEFDGEVLSISQ